MCIQDVALARNTEAVEYGTVTTPYNLKPNPRRRSVIVQATGSITVQTRRGSTVALVTGIQSLETITATTTTQVRPGTDTTNFSVSGDTAEVILSLDLDEYGCLITDNLVISTFGGTAMITEVSYNDIADKAINEHKLKG